MSGAGRAAIARTRAPRIAALALAALLARALPAGAVQFTYEPIHGVASDTLGALIKIQGLVTNLEETPQTFTILKDATFPPGWSASICVRDFCYAPFVGKIDKAFLPGEAILISSYVQSNGDPGSAEVVMTVQPKDVPEEAVVQHLGAISGTLDALIVDDGAGTEAVALAAAALPAGKTTGTWPREAAAPTAEELALHGAVLWLAGPAGPGLDADDRPAIDAYLDGGGHLFVAGGNVAYDLGDPGSANASDVTRAWLSDRFHVAYGAGEGGGETATGMPGDSIADGLSLQIASTSLTEAEMTDGVAAAGDGVAFLGYEGSAQVAAVRASGAAPKSIFLAVDFGSTGDEAARAQLIARSLDYFASEPGSFDPPKPGHPDGSFLGPNVPNPFRTTRFAIRSALGGAAALSVIDASGRRVRTLLSSAIAPGETPVDWDGRDDDGDEVPSGIYFALFTHAGRTETRKIDLVR